MQDLAQSICTAKNQPENKTQTSRFTRIWLISRRCRIIGVDTQSLAFRSAVKNDTKN
ncbi:hypothetical protein HanIR_Chr12g0594711 [Helianthus annuus]|nr:hypothetical protein HanIR_Chr12g0594711 [Helianthus annuus]